MTSLVPREHPRYRGRMPVLFVARLAAERDRGERVESPFRALARGLPEPRAIRCVSAHGFVRGTSGGPVPGESPTC